MAAAGRPPGQTLLPPKKPLTFYDRNSRNIFQEAFYALVRSESFTYGILQGWKHRPMSLRVSTRGGNRLITGLVQPMHTCNCKLTLITSQVESMETTQTVRRATPVPFPECTYVHRYELGM